MCVWITSATSDKFQYAKTMHVESEPIMEGDPYDVNSLRFIRGGCKSKESKWVGGNSLGKVHTGETPYAETPH